MIETPRLRDEPLPPGAPDLEALERRVAHLEDAVAALQDTAALEDRLATRVAERIHRGPAASGVLIEVGRRLLPAFGPAIPSGSDGASAGRAWLFSDLYTELRAIFWMYLDRRYRVGWTCRLLPPVFLVVLLMSWWVLGGVPFVGPLLDKTFDVALVVVTYKVLSREAQRYREAILSFGPPPV